MIMTKEKEKCDICFGAGYCASEFGREDCFKCSSTGYLKEKGNILQDLENLKGNVCLSCDNCPHCIHNDVIDQTKKIVEANMLSGPGKRHLIYKMNEECPICEELKEKLRKFTKEE